MGVFLWQLVGSPIPPQLLSPDNSREELSVGEMLEAQHPESVPETREPGGWQAAEESRV